MPPSSLPKARPGLFRWIGFALVAILTIGVIKAAFYKASGRRSSQTSSGAVSQDAYYGKGEAMGVPSMPGSVPAPMPSREYAKDMPPSGADTTAIEQKIIKTGELNLRVADTLKAVENIRQIASGKKGLVESSSVSDPGTGPRTGWVTVRVPVDQFDATLAELKGVAVLVLHESVNGQDVTAEFVDMDANLRNARAEEQSYLEILKRSGDIEDVLAVTQRLAEVRGRIERLEAQKRYLSNRTDLATINVSMTEETRVNVPGKTWQPLETLRQALRDLVETLQNLVNFLIRLVIAVIGLLVPIAILTALIIWIGWKIVLAFLGRLRK